MGDVQTVPPGHWSLDFPDWAFPHECLIEGGGREMSVIMEERKEWPPRDAAGRLIPAFVIAGVRSDYSLVRRWLRHIWLEAYFGIGTFFVVGGPPGLGKSTAGLRFGEWLNPTWEMGRQVVYDFYVAVRGIEAWPLMDLIYMDEALGRGGWSQKWREEEVQEFIVSLWEKARRYKKIIGLCFQSEGAANWVLRDSGLVGWWWIIKKRDARTGLKFAKLRHAIPLTEFYMKRFHAFKMERGSAFRDGGEGTIPPISPSVIEAYNALRDEGLTRDEEALPEERASDLLGE